MRTPSNQLSSSKQWLLYFSLATNVCLLLVVIVSYRVPPPPTPHQDLSTVNLNAILTEHSEMRKAIEELKQSTKTKDVVSIAPPIQDQGSPSKSPNAASPNKSRPPAAVPEIIDFNCGSYALGSQCYNSLPHDYKYWNYKTGHSEFPDICSIMNCIDEMGHLFGMHYPDKALNSDNSQVGMLAFSIADFAFFDFVVSQHPELVNFTEFGTASGVTSLYIGMIAKIRGGNLITFDFRNTRCKESLRGWLDDVMTFQLADLLSSPNADAISALRRSPQIAFMDNGDKPKEINTYARYLDVGSIIITHDYPGEWKMPAIEKEIKARGYIPIYEDYAFKLGSVARAFARVEAGDGVVMQ